MTRMKKEPSHRFDASTYFDHVDNDTNGDEEGKKKPDNNSEIPSGVGSQRPGAPGTSPSSGDKDPMERMKRIEKADAGGGEPEGALEALVRLDRNVCRRESDLMDAKKGKGKSKLRKLKKLMKKKSNNKKGTDHDSDVEDDDDDDDDDLKQYQQVVETCEAFSSLLSMMEDEKAAALRRKKVGEVAPQGECKAAEPKVPAINRGNEIAIAGAAVHGTESDLHQAPAGSPQETTARAKHDKIDQKQPGPPSTEDLTSSASEQAPTSKPQRKGISRASLYGRKQSSARNLAANDISDSKIDKARGRSSQSGNGNRAGRNDPLGPSKHRGTRTARRSSKSPLRKSDHSENGRSHKGRRSRSSDTLGSSEHRKTRSRRSSKDLLGKSGHRKTGRSRSNDDVGSSGQRGGRTRRSSKDPLWKSEHRSNRAKLDTSPARLPRSRSLRNMASSSKPRSASAGELSSMSSPTQPAADGAQNTVWANSSTRRPTRRQTASRMMTAAGIQVELRSKDEVRRSGKHRSLSRGDSDRRLRGVRRSRSFQDGADDNGDIAEGSVEEVFKTLSASRGVNSQTKAAVDTTWEKSQRQYEDELEEEFVVSLNDNVDDGEHDTSPRRPSSCGDLKSLQDSPVPARPGLLRRMESVSSFFGKGQGNVGASLQSAIKMSRENSRDTLDIRPANEKLDDILLSLRREKKRDIMRQQKKSKNLSLFM